MKYNLKWSKIFHFYFNTALLIQNEKINEFQLFKSMTNKYAVVRTRALSQCNKLYKFWSKIDNKDVYLGF